MVRYSNILLFISVQLCGAGMLLAQQSPATISLAENQSGRIYLNEYPWRFHAGDDLAWARPDVDDSRWDTLQPNFGNDQLPKGWNGYGWFRIWVKKDALTATTALGLYLNHDGASEVYWNGQKVAGIGTFSTSADQWKPKRNPYAMLPLAITDTLPHLLAIRYSNHEPAFSDFVGFQLWAGDLHSMNTQQKENQRFMDFQLMSGAAQAILIVLHLLLFVCYPKNKVNLYYSLFVLNTSSILVFRYLTITATDPSTQLFAWRAFLTATTSINLTQLLLLYNVSYPKLPIKRLLLIGVACLVLIAYRNIHLERVISTNSRGLWDWLEAAVALLASAEGIRAVIHKIRKDNNRLWLIAAGMILVTFFNLMGGMNLFGWFTLTQVLTAMAFATLIFPLIFSIYLALDVADTNRNLTTQLAENDALAARALAEEQEKNRLIAGQAEQLEKTVLARTAQVRAQAEKLQEMDAMKSRFFVNLTHEFKTPLTLIANPARELLAQADTEAGKQYARYILQNSERLLQLINQLLDLSKLENGGMEIQAEPVEVVGWLRAHVQQYHSLAEPRRITLAFSSSFAELWIAADLDKMEKIVQNLLSNAFKFSVPEGRIAIILANGGNGSFSLTVADTGAGIPPSKLPYIFDRFYQVDPSDTRAKEGAGVGLALTRELAELLGGSIAVESLEGRGTTFVVTLPYTVVPPGVPAAPLPASGPMAVPSDAESISGPTTDELPLILVVEDNADLRAFIALSLTGDYTVITASDGIEGIDSALERIPSLVVTDLMMPGKDGYQLCQALKTNERTSHIPIIMLTAKADQNSKIRGIITGADAYLAKPFDRRELLALLDNLIHTRTLLREKYGKNNRWLTNATELPSIEQVFLERVRKAVETHIDDEQYSADRLSSDVGLSRTQLHRKLKALINQSPGELVRSVRMQRAYDLLQQRVATVAEVGYMVGYGNPANFSTSFSKHFGFPPSEVPAS